MYMQCRIVLSVVFVVAILIEVFDAALCGKMEFTAFDKTTLFIGAAIKFLYTYIVNVLVLGNITGKYYALHSNIFS